MRTLYFYLLFFFLSFTCFCQAPSVRTTAVENAREFYSQSIGPGAALYNAVEYKEPILENNKGIPYYLIEELTEGSVVYNGHEYDNILMQYDVANDKLVIDHEYSHFKMELISEKVNSFKLLDHTFVRLKADDVLKNTVIKTGFYEQLYSGSVKLYARHKKRVHESVDAQRGVEFTFTDKTNFFLYKDSHYYPIKSRAAIVRILSDQKELLKKYIRMNKLTYHKNEVQCLTKIVEFYDQLIVK